MMAVSVSYERDAGYARCDAGLSPPPGQRQPPLYVVSLVNEHGERRTVYLSDAGLVELLKEVRMARRVLASARAMRRGR
jgi:hypothetical protein